MQQHAVLQNAGDTNVLTHVSTFRQRLLQANEHARKHLDEAQARMKTWFDRKAKDRHFVVGQKVLVLLPGLKGALQARFEGPFVISKKVSVKPGGDRRLTTSSRTARSLTPLPAAAQCSSEQPYP